MPGKSCKENVFAAFSNKTTTESAIHTFRKNAEKQMIPLNFKEKLKHAFKVQSPA